MSEIKENGLDGVEDFEAPVTGEPEGEPKDSGKSVVELLDDIDSTFESQDGFRHIFGESIGKNAESYQAIQDLRVFSEKYPQLHSYSEWRAFELKSIAKSANEAAASKDKKLQEDVVNEMGVWTSTTEAISELVSREPTESEKGVLERFADLESQIRRIPTSTDQGTDAKRKKQQALRGHQSNFLAITQQEGEKERELSLKRFASRLPMAL